MSIEGGKVGDKINRELFERQRRGGRNRGKWGMSGVMINFVLLTYSTSCDKGVDK